MRGARTKGSDAGRAATTKIVQPQALPPDGGIMAEAPLLRGVQWLHRNDIKESKNGGVVTGN